MWPAQAVEHVVLIRCNAKNLTYSWHPEKPSGETQVCSGASGDRCRMAVVSSCWKCWVKSRNERKLYPCLQASTSGTPGRLPQVINRGVTTSSHHGPYGSYTRATMAHTEGSKLASIVSESQKVRRSPIGSSVTRLTKSESLVIVNQNVTVNVPWPCTHRPSHHAEWAAKEVGSLTLGGRATTRSSWPGKFANKVSGGTLGRIKFHTKADTIMKRSRPRTTAFCGRVESHFTNNVID